MSYSGMGDVWCDSNGDAWDIHRNYERATYVLRNRVTHEHKEVDMDEIDRHRKLRPGDIHVYSPDLWAREALRVYNEQLKYERQWRPKDRRPLANRWRSRMLRLTDAAIARRMRPVYKVLWGVGWLWGILLISAVTFKLVGYLNWLLLG